MEHGGNSAWKVSLFHISSSPALHSSGYLIHFYVGLSLLTQAMRAYIVIWLDFKNQECWL